MNQEASVNGQWARTAGDAADITYQFLVCDDAPGKPWSHGLMISQGGCWKKCSHWCNDSSPHMYRTSASYMVREGPFGGTAFRENGHQVVTQKLMTVYIRDKDNVPAPETPKPTAEPVTPKPTAEPVTPKPTAEPVTDPPTIKSVCGR